MTGVEIALAVAGGALQAVSAIQQANAAASAARYNADVAERNRVIADQDRQTRLRQKQIEAEDERRRQRRVLGAINAQFGASGFAATGSSLDVLEDAAFEGELDALRIEEQGRTEHRAGALEMLGYESEAELERANAKNAKTAGYLGAAAGLIGGGARAAGAYQRGQELERERGRAA